MSDTIHLAKLSSLLKAAHREAVALADESPDRNLSRQAVKWHREIEAIEYEVTMRSQARKY